MTQSTQDIWLYCINCERAFRSSSKNSCNYSGCEGELGDVWEWEVIRKLNQGYPKIPVFGREYPLYGDGRFVNLRRAGYDEESRSLPYNC